MTINPLSYGEGAMRIQTGNPVRGDDFFVRENLVEQTWEHLASGSHILIAAPRRVGKTSLMRYLEDCPRPPFSFIYLITESVNSENEFYRRILNRIVKTAFVKKDIIGSLAYDGYINNHDEVHRYRFNSPILKMWWRQNVAN
jgi:predicted AAA+ superfamily ATPase